MAFLSGPPGSALVLEGEPGIGKTTLWRAGIEEAGRHGLRLLACSPPSGETQLSFAALGAQGGNQVFRVLNLWALGFLELSLGDSAAAHRHLHSLPDAVDSMGYWNPGVRPVYADAIEARIGVGDLDVDDRIDDLERRGRALDNPWARAAAARCRGLLRAARGDPFGAIAELERALVEHENSPHQSSLGGRCSYSARRSGGPDNGLPRARS